MNRYSFVTVWPHASDEIQAEAVRFWLHEGALPEGKAVERAEQLLVICRDSDHSIAAVSTVLPTFIQTLGLSCYYFRAFVGTAHRAHGLRGSKLIYSLIRKSYDVLNDRFQQGMNRDVVGLYLEIENRSLLRHRRELVWTDLGANVVFVGTLPRGHARVWYFENAKGPARD